MADALCTSSWKGRYDAFLISNCPLKKAVTAEDGPYHQYADKLSWFPYKGIPTYPLIHRDERGEKFIKNMKKQSKSWREDGTLAKLSQQYFKEDVFSYVDKD